MPTQGPRSHARSAARDSAPKMLVAVVSIPLSDGQDMEQVKDEFRVRLLDLKAKGVTVEFVEPM